MSDAIAKVTALFFDKEGVKRAVDDATRRSLSWAGAFIRTTARQSMKAAGPGKYSSPGSPPFAHGGKHGALLKKFLLFSYDPTYKSVVIGPVGFANSVAPHVEEFGGSVTRRVRRGRQKGRTVTARYPARPYMGPALQKNLDAIPEAFRDSIRQSG